MRSGRHINAINEFIKGMRLGGVHDQVRLNHFLFTSIRKVINQTKSETQNDGLTSLINQVKAYLNVNNIICIGDSHVNIFEIGSSLKVYQTGSPTAYNLGNVDPLLEQ